jgi:hypothetical protein
LEEAESEIASNGNAKIVLMDFALQTTASIQKNG